MTPSNDDIVRCLRDRDAGDGASSPRIPPPGAGPTAVGARPTTDVYQATPGIWVCGLCQRRCAPPPPPDAFSRVGIKRGKRVSGWRGGSFEDREYPKHLDDWYRDNPDLA
jgi:hypothetical protein